MSVCQSVSPSLPPVDNSQAVDEDEPVEKLVDHVQGTECSKLEVGLVFLEVCKFGGVLEEALKVGVFGPVGPEEVEELLEGEVTELHLDTEAGDGGAVAGVAGAGAGLGAPGAGGQLGAWFSGVVLQRGCVLAEVDEGRRPCLEVGGWAGGACGQAGGAVLILLLLLLLPVPLLLDQEAVEILDDVLVLADLREVLHLLQHLVQVLPWLDLDLLDGKDPVVKFVLSLEDLAEVA